VFFQENLSFVCQHQLMRKYFQITSILGIFAVLVLIRQHVGKETLPFVKSQNVNLPTQTQIVAPTLSQGAQQTINPSAGSGPPASTLTPSGTYRNGTFAGSVQDAFYGNIQVQIVISNGKLSDVVFLQYPNDNRTSQYVNSQALAILKQEAITAQNSNVDIVSGASASSRAFQQSLASALAQAKL
jgi:uncharacterized protein with FMN-binding domain